MGETPKAAVSREDLKPAVDALIDEIVNGSDTHWQAYATRLAEERALGESLGMYKYWSANNMFWLWAQARRRGSSVKGLYGGVDQWRKRGRSIRVGESPFYIWGPPGFWVDPARQRKNKNKNKNKTNSQTQQQAAKTQNQPQRTVAQQATVTAQQGAAAAPGQRVYVHRKTPPVFEVYDYTQTVADDPDYVEPDWAVPLAAGDLDTLHLLASTSPVPVSFTDIGSRTENGWLDADGIVVDSSMETPNRIYTLVHELAHHHLGHLDQVKTTAHPAETDDEETFSAHARCEQEAALTQYLVMKMLRLDETVGNNVTEAAGSYLRTWMRTDRDGKQVPLSEGNVKTKRKLVLKRFDAAFKAASAIAMAYQQVVAERSQETATPALPATA